MPVEIGRAILMFALCTKDLIEQFGPPNLQERSFLLRRCSPRRRLLLATFKEGVEWLINGMARESCPIYLSPTVPPSKVRKTSSFIALQERALRLLGIATHNPPPAQNLHEAGEAVFLRRLAGALHAEIRPNDILGRLDADLCLFDDSPKSSVS